MLQTTPKTRFFTQAVGVALCLMMAGAASAKDQQELPEVDKNGLHLVKDAPVRVAYVLPGAKLSDYSKVMLVDCYVEFKKDYERDYNLNEVGLEGRIRDKDIEKMKANLAAEFKKVFSDTLTKNGHEVVDLAGPDVLLIRPAIVNLDVAAPDLMRAGMGNTWVSSAGSMTLYMELYDSGSSKLIGRVADPQADNSNFAQIANKVTNKSAADRILEKWAKLLSDHLAAVKAGS
jgi:hypothetical protein